MRNSCGRGLRPLAWCLPLARRARSFLHTPTTSKRLLRRLLGPVHTKKVCVFVFIEKASMNSRSHYRFDAFSTVRAKKFENDRIARCDVS